MNTTPSPSRSTIGLVLALITTVSMLIAGCGVRIHPSFASSHPPTPVPATPTLTPDLSDPLVRRRHEVAEMRKRLQTSNLEPRSRQALERNLEIIEGDVRMIETARALPPDWKAPSVASPTLVPTVMAIPNGILERFNHPPPYPNSVTFTSAWQDQINGEWVRVFAGVSDSEPEQGFVYMRKDKGHEYPTPTQVGAVTITAYEGTVLTLTSADGTTFLFDVATGTFLSE